MGCTACRETGGDDVNPMDIDQVQYSDTINWACSPGGRLRPSARIAGTYNAGAKQRLTVPSNFNPQQSPGFDVFFVHPTTYRQGESIGPNQPITMGRSDSLIAECLDKMATAFDSTASIYAPYYRQADTEHLHRLNPQLRQRALRMAQDDVILAFRVFMQTFNRDTATGYPRPFFLAGAGQGARHLLELLKLEFEGDTPQAQQWRSQLVAAYLLGSPVVPTELSKLPFCDGANDLGCVVCFNTSDGEAGNVGVAKCMPCVCVNPLDWSLNSGQQVGASQHRGSLLEGVPGELECQLATELLAAVSTTNGSLEISCDVASMRPLVHKVSHSELGPEFRLFWADLRANAAQRACTWQLRQRFLGLGADQQAVLRVTLLREVFAALPHDQLRKIEVTHVFALAQVARLNGPRGELWRDEEHSRLHRVLQAYGSEMQREAEFVRHWDRLLPGEVHFFCQAVSQFNDLATSLSAQAAKHQQTSTRESHRQRKAAVRAEMIQNTVMTSQTPSPSPSSVGSPTSVRKPSRAAREESALEAKLRRWDELSEEKALQMSQQRKQEAAAAAKETSQDRRDGSPNRGSSEGEQSAYARKQREQEAAIDQDIQNRRKAQAERRKVAEQARLAEQEAREDMMRRIHQDAARKATAAAEHKAAERAERLAQDRIQRRASERASPEREKPAGNELMYSPTYDAATARRAQSPHTPGVVAGSRPASANATVRRESSGAKERALERIERYERAERERRASGSPHQERKGDRAEQLALERIERYEKATKAAHKGEEGTQEARRMSRSLFSPEASERSPTPTPERGSPRASPNGSPSMLEQRMLRGRAEAKAQAADARKSGER